MPDWTTYVRSRLDLHDVRPQHEQDVVDDLAGQLEEAYREVARRLGILPEGGPQDLKGPKTLQ